MAKKVKREIEEVRFKLKTNDELVCKDCLLNNVPDKRLTLSCDRFTIKPQKVLKGGDCDEYIKR